MDWSGCFEERLLDNDSIVNIPYKLDASLDSLTKFDTIRLISTDIDFIKSQITNNKKFKFKKKYLPNARFKYWIKNGWRTGYFRVIGKNKYKARSDSLEHRRYFDSYHYGTGIWILSFAFTPDMQTAFLSCANHIAALAGNGRTNIYKKIDGKWVYVTSICYWVS